MANRRKQHMVGVRLDDAELEAVTREAERWGLSPPGAIRRMIRAYGAESDAKPSGMERLGARAWQEALKRADEG